MPRATIVAQSLAHGLQPDYTAIASADGAKVAYDATDFIHAKNTTGGALVLDVRTNVTLDGDLNLPDRLLTIDAGEDAFTKTFARSVYRQTDGFLYIDVDDDGLTIAVLKP